MKKRILICIFALSIYSNNINGSASGEDIDSNDMLKAIEICDSQDESDHCDKSTTESAKVSRKRPRAESTSDHARKRARADVDATHLVTRVEGPKTTQSEGLFANIPEEVLDIIVKELPLVDWCNLAAACRGLRNRLENESFAKFLWDTKILPRNLQLPRMEGGARTYTLNPILCLPRLYKLSSKEIDVELCTEIWKAENNIYKLIDLALNFYRIFDRRDCNDRNRAERTNSIHFIMRFSSQQISTISEFIPRISIFFMNNSMRLKFLTAAIHLPPEEIRARCLAIEENAQYLFTRTMADGEKGNIILSLIYLDPYQIAAVGSNAAKIFGSKMTSVDRANIIKAIACLKPNEIRAICIHIPALFTTKMENAELEDVLRTIAPLISTGGVSKLCVAIKNYTSHLTDPQNPIQASEMKVLVALSSEQISAIVDVGLIKGSWDTQLRSPIIEKLKLRTPEQITTLGNAIKNYTQAASVKSDSTRAARFITLYPLKQAAPNSTQAAETLSLLSFSQEQIKAIVDSFLSCFTHTGSNGRILILENLKTKDPIWIGTIGTNAQYLFTHDMKANEFADIIKAIKVLNPDGLAKLSGAIKDNTQYLFPGQASAERAKITQALVPHMKEISKLCRRIRQYVSLSFGQNSPIQSIEILALVSFKPNLALGQIKAIIANATCLFLPSMKGDARARIISTLKLLKPEQIVERCQSLEFYKNHLSEVVATQDNDEHLALVSLGPLQLQEIVKRFSDLFPCEMPGNERAFIMRALAPRTHNEIEAIGINALSLFIPDMKSSERASIISALSAKTPQAITNLCAAIKKHRRNFISLAMNSDAQAKITKALVTLNPDQIEAIGVNASSLLTREMKADDIEKLITTLKLLTAEEIASFCCIIKDYASSLISNRHNPIQVSEILVLALLKPGQINAVITNVDICAMADSERVRTISTFVSTSKSPEAIREYKPASRQRNNYTDFYGRLFDRLAPSS